MRKIGYIRTSFRNQCQIRGPATRTGVLHPLHRIPFWLATEDGSNLQRAVVLYVQVRPPRRHTLHARPPTRPPTVSAHLTPHLPLAPLDAPQVLQPAAMRFFPAVAKYERRGQYEPIPS